LRSSIGIIFSDIYHLADQWISLKRGCVPYGPHVT